MNVFNRLVIILLILIVMTLVPLALIFPEQTEYVLWFGSELVRANLEWLSVQTAATQIGIRLLLGAVALGVFLVGVLFLGLEVIRLRRNTVKLRDGSGELIMDGVAGHLSYHIDLLPDVIRARPQVQSKGRSVVVSLYVETAPDVSIPAKSAEIRETARQVIEEQLGLRISREIKVLIKPVTPSQLRYGRKRPWQQVPLIERRAPEIEMEPTEHAPDDEVVHGESADSLLEEDVPLGVDPDLPSPEVQSKVVEVKRPGS